MNDSKEIEIKQKLSLITEKALQIRKMSDDFVLIIEETQNSFRQYKDVVDSLSKAKDIITHND